jgi:hypothetical protein
MSCLIDYSSMFVFQSFELAKLTISNSSLTKGSLSFFVLIKRDYPLMKALWFEKKRMI